MQTPVVVMIIVAFRGERGSYNSSGGDTPPDELSRLPAAVYKGRRTKNRARLNRSARKKSTDSDALPPPTQYPGRRL